MKPWITPNNEISSKKIATKNSIKYLNVYSDKALDFCNHVDFVVGTLSGISGFIYSNWPFINPKMSLDVPKVVYKTCQLHNINGLLTYAAGANINLKIT